MGRQFISAAISGQKHSSDIYSVAISRPYTVTTGGDGYINFWKNTILETQSPSDHVITEFVDKIGLHHLSVFEDIIEGHNIGLVAAVTFSGTLIFYELNKSGPKKRSDIVLPGDKPTNWAIEFCRDFEGPNHKFVATQSNGNALVYNFKASPPTEEGGNSIFEFISSGTIKPKNGNFAMSVAVSPKAFLAAIGYSNGDIVVAELDTCRPIFTFYKPTTSSNSGGVSGSIRNLKFSPSGNILACAYDSGKFGNISLYDAKYGEIIGNLTTPTNSANNTSNVNAHNGWIFALDFNDEGDLLLSGGFDSKLRIWNVESREREATINLSIEDFPDDETDEKQGDASKVLDAKFISKGIRLATGSATNDGIVCVGMDRGVRWYREAGGI